MDARRQPRYAELAAELIAAIRRGRWRIGTLLPTERELCQQHSVSRHTARAALAQVAAMGLVVRRPGAGTRVIASGEPMRYQHAVDSIETLLQYGRVTRLEITASARIAANPEVAAALNLAPGDELLRLAGLRYGEPQHDPICTTEIFLAKRPGLPLRKLLDLASASRAVIGVLDLRRIDHVEQVFDATVLSAANAQLLGAPAHTAALRVMRRYQDQGGEPFAYAISLHPEGRFSYRVALARRRHGQTTGS